MAVRDQIYAELDGMCRPDGMLDPTSFRLPGIDAAGDAAFDRAHARIEAVEEYFDRQQAIPQQGLAAVITAGPPGAGKTAHVLDSYRPTEWRVIDPDVVKDLILASEVPAGTFERFLTERLPDGHPIMPRELAGLVHRESMIITDIIRRRSLAVGENVVIEGTLTWPPHGPRLLRELAAAGYARLDIVSVDVPKVEALHRTKHRWWAGRQAAIDGSDPLGGRFVPTAVVANAYDDSGANLCAANARATFTDLAARSFDHVQLTTHSGTRSETVSAGDTEI